MNPVADVFSMSLDEYIATKKDNFAFEEGAYFSKRFNPFNGKNYAGSESSFKAERRPCNEDELDEDEDDDMLGVETSVDNTTPRNTEKSDNGMRQEPRSITSYSDIDYTEDNCENEKNDSFDLRELINNSSISENQRNRQRFLSSRINVQNRQQSFENIDENFQKRRNFYRKNANRNFFRKTFRGNNWGNSNNQNGNKHHYKRNAGNNNGVNKTDFFNNSCPINQNVNNQQIKEVLDCINGSYRSTIRPRTITIGCQSNTSTIVPKPVEAIEKKTTQAPKDLATILGVTDSSTLTLEALPDLATKFLDYLQVGQRQTITHKPSYDMNIQKQIHNIQGKSLTYKCPSGEVVSADGTGIDDCQITPNATGVSLNYRFG